jgi:hypothetical protein
MKQFKMGMGMGMAGHTQAVFLSMESLFHAAEVYTNRNCSQTRNRLALGHWGPQRLTAPVALGLGEKVNFHNGFRSAGLSLTRLAWTFSVNWQGMHDINGKKDNQYIRW